MNARDATHSTKRRAHLLKRIGLRGLRTYRFGLKTSFIVLGVSRFHTIISNTEIALIQSLNFGSLIEALIISEVYFENDGQCCQPNTGRL